MIPIYLCKNSLSLGTYFPNYVYVKFNLVKVSIDL